MRILKNNKDICVSRAHLKKILSSILCSACSRIQIISKLCILELYIDTRFVNYMIDRIMASFSTFAFEFQSPGPTHASKVNKSINLTLLPSLNRTCLLQYFLTPPYQYFVNKQFISSFILSLSFKIGFQIFIFKIIKNKSFKR